jgi:hypothetical protein
MKKLMLFAAFAVGYLLGARAGRERYTQIMGVIDRLRNDPRVQETTHHAMDVAKHQAPVVADKVTHAAASAASAAAARVRHSEPEPDADLTDGRSARRPAVGVTSAARARPRRWHR